MPSTRGGAGSPPAKPPPPARTASSSSLSSSRQDRNARLSALLPSATPHSRSSEEMSEPPRRSQRSHPAKKEDDPKDDIAADDEAVEDEEEVTRCVCGHLDYPGPPLSEAFDTVDALSEDAGGLFISCDGCSVWQHGGCVGILEEAQVPDKYYCEECRPKLHDLHTDVRGQRYSLYQPVYGKTSRKPSISKHGEKSTQDRELAASRASADPGTGRRRATMRSKEHDDEEEQFLRAIEESKRDVEAPGTGTGRRNGKRAREEHDDSKSDVKRARRTSELIPPGLRTALVDEDSDEESTIAQTSRGKRARADAVQSARQAELREKEKEREKTRAEAAGRRQERAGRRRADDEPDEETPKPSTSTKPSPPPPSSQAESPPPQSGPSDRPGHRGSGPGKRAKKLGNNLLGKTRGAPTSSPPNGKRAQPGSNGQSTSSGDEHLANGDEPRRANSNGGTGKNSPERTIFAKGKLSKGKQRAVNGNGGRHGPEDPSDLSMATMKRRMEAMAAFVAKAQADLAGDRTPGNGATPAAGTSASTNTNGAAIPTPHPDLVAGEAANAKSLDEMNAMELGDVVVGRIVDWQQRFAHVVS